MKNKDFEDIGDRIQEIIEDAIYSRDYQKLNQTINQTINKAVNHAVETGNDALKNIINTGKNSIPKPESYRKDIIIDFKKPETVQKEKSPQLYSQITGVQVIAILQSIIGVALFSSMGLGFLATIVWGSLTSGSFWIAAAVFLGVFTSLGAILSVKGFRKLAKLERFKTYKKLLGEHTYCNISEMAEKVRKPIALIKKDIVYMIDKKWFLEGHMDKQETCLITSDETYKQYMDTQRELERRQKEERPEVDIDQRTSKEVQEVLDKGNEYLIKIRKSNDAIPGVEISKKISKMELIIKKIFERAQQHPEIIPDLKRLMNYYLPTTIKLLDAYEDMDQQPIQGENIASAKKEIEDTLDTLNIAFEKLFDSIFQDTAMDVSSDISVLNTLLAQEGLMEDDISRMKK